MYFSKEKLFRIFFTKIFLSYKYVYKNRDRQLNEK